MGRLDAMGLRLEGFGGFVAVGALREDANQVPTSSGAYAVVRTTARPRRFLPVSPASHFKGKDPTVSVERLRTEWVEGAQLLYVGSAGVLRDRVGLLIEFSDAGETNSVGHWGGRLLWQVEGSDDFEVAWKTTTEGEQRDLAHELVAEFEATWGVLPFANLKRPPSG